MHINFIEFLFAKFLQKLHGLSKKLSLPINIQRNIYKIHFKYITYLLTPYFHKSMENLKANFKGEYNSHIIWMFWWQGNNNMPFIVKKCILSVKKNARNPVILITKYNINHYIHISHDIYNKIDENKLDLTHFSDLLRFSLLNKYGGLWIDSTIYCTSTIQDTCFNYIYTTGGYHNTLPEFVKGRWAEFLIGSNKHNSAIEFVSRFLLLYFKANNYLINYFVADYAINYAYNHNLGGFKEYADKDNHNNPNLFKMIGLLDKPFNKEKYELITSNTNMFKLTYKKKFHTGNTFYSELFN